jgi:iron complex outermembrane receptor protein
MKRNDATRARATRRGLFSVLLAVGCTMSAFAAESPTVPFELPEIAVIATTPVGGTGITEDQYPGNVQIINLKDMPANARSLPEVLDQAVGSATINNTQGNPYVVDLNYRGFTASPVLGTPQGVSVFLDGMRVNEPFGDIVSWDLIPQIAIANVTMVPGSNPVFGLNTLGGAVAINTKSGFAFPGGDAKVTLGSFGRRSLD